MKRKTSKVRKKVSTKIKNPTELEVRGKTKIFAKPRSDGKYILTIWYEDEPVIEQMVDRHTAQIATSPKGRESIYRRIHNRLTQRTNPKKEEDKKVEESILIPTSLGSVALPKTPLEAYRFGYRNGLEKGLNYCGITDFFTRRNIRHKLQRDLQDTIDAFHRQTEAIGVIGGAKLPKLAS